MKICVFDIETFRNYFCLGAIVWDSDTKTEVARILLESDDNDNIRTETLNRIDSLFASSDYIVSFHGSRFDLPVLAKMKSDIARLGKTTARYVHADAQAIISYDRFNNPLVRRHCTVRAWSSKHFDLFNNCLLSKSLKQWQMYNNLPIRELPYNPQVDLTPEQKVEIGEYCMHDVSTTSTVFWKLGFDKGMPGCPTLLTYIEVLKMWPKSLPFKFDRTVSALSAGIIYETSTPIAPATNQPLALIDMNEFEVPVDLKLMIAYIAKNPNNQAIDAVFRGIKYGRGGAHMIVPGRHEKVHVFDFGSHYPGIIERWRLLKTPAANTRWTTLKQTRMAVKHAGKDKYLDGALKLVLNGLTGTFRIKSSYSVAYDPAAGEAMCFAAQLMVSELAFKAPDWDRVIEVNTDSVFVTGDENANALRAASVELVKRYGIEIDEEILPLVYIRDVNNYIAYNEDKSVMFGKGLAYSDMVKKNSIRAVYGELFRNLIEPTLTLDWTKYSWEDFIFKYHKSAASKYATIGGESMTHKNYYMMWTTKDCPDASPIGFSRDAVNRKNGSIKGRYGVYAFDIADLEKYAPYIDYDQYLRDLDDELDLWGREDLCTTRLTKLQRKNIKTLSDLTILG